MKEIIQNIKKAWQESKKQKAIIIALIALLIFGSVWVVYSICHYYMEFKSYENWLRICFAMLVLYCFPIMYFILDIVSEKNRALKRILAMEEAEEKEIELEAFEFFTCFRFLAEILARLSAIVLIVFINELLTQIPQISEDINYIATREAYWGFLQIILYIFVLYAAIIIPYSDSFLFCRKCRIWKIRKMMKKSGKKDVEHALQD